MIGENAEPLDKSAVGHTGEQVDVRRRIEAHRGQVNVLHRPQEPVDFTALDRCSLGLPLSNARYLSLQVFTLEARV